MSLKLISSEKPHATMSRQFHIRLEWRPEKTYPAGTEIELRSACIRSFFNWKQVGMTVSGAELLYKRTSTLFPNTIDPFDRTLAILRARLPGGARPGDTIEIDMTVIPPIWAGLGDKLSIWYKEPFDEKAQDPSATLFRAEKNSTCEIPVAPGPVEMFCIYSKPAPGTDGKVRTRLSPEDRFGNPSAFEKPVRIRLEWDGKEWEEEITAPKSIFLDRPKSIARLKASVPMSALSYDENVRNGTSHNEYLIVTGNPVWPGPVDGLLPAFGEIHWHTEFSGDGQGCIDNAFLFARDALNMDFAAPGDHNPTPAQWEKTVESAEKFNEPGTFATFFGWENGTPHGHENYYFTDPAHPLICGGKAGLRTGRPDEITDLLEKHDDFIAVPHHTNSVSENLNPEGNPYFFPYPWTRPIKNRHLVEIMQLRGNQERNDYPDAWRGWQQNNGASAQDALAMGHRLGFTGGTDNHCALPGRAFNELAGPGRHCQKSVILTGVWTKKVDRQSIFETLHARHTWAVWDTRAIVHFTVNGVLMGGELSIEKDEALTARIRISAEDSFQSIEIVSEGRPVWLSSFHEQDINLTVPLGNAEATTHFYLRALLRNGGLIYASPVFLLMK